jgi:phosphatidylserine/phosphatidylglycerophosphate/cardiolipin synthase-like enzyme
MTNQRSTLLSVIVIVAAIVLIALAFSKQQQAVKDTEIAGTAQAAAESDQATAVANAEIAATAQAVAESNQGTAIADAEMAAAKQAVAESNEGTAIANAEMAMTAQAVAESNEATAVADVKTIQGTATLSAEIMATVFADMDAERATAVAIYETLAATATQITLDFPGDSAGEVVNTLAVDQGYGAAKGFWQVYFTAPTGSSDSDTYTGGIDVPLAEAINGVQHTLDIAAFEFNDAVLTQAVLDAKARGVDVRFVTDDENGIGDEEDISFAQFIEAGIPVVDDGRSALMHDKFMILDGTTVWTGSWNYATNNTYRNNNNALALTAPAAVQAYQAEFDEMFTDKKFGPHSPTGNAASFTVNDVPIQILFPSEDDAVGAIETALNAAEHSIQFMAFSFTLDDIGQLLIDKANAGVDVKGIFETRGSTTSFSELPALFCAGMDVRQDGNRYVMHHKVFVIDDTTVITGSFNFSSASQEDNDENLVIISDPDLAAQYLAEFDRLWAEAVTPDGVECN